MRNRPWPILLIAAFHLLAPIPNALLSAALERVPLLVYLRGFSGKLTLFEVVSGWLVYPVAAWAIYSMKRWSYGVYLGCMALIAYSNYLSWRMYPQNLSLSWCIGMIATDLLVTGYFLLPAVRATYFDPRLRWWESKPRFQLDLPASIEGGWGAKTIELVNISEGGAFIRTPISIERGDRLSLSFEVLGRVFTVAGHVVHSSPRPPRGYGIQFDLTPRTQRLMADFTRALKLLGFHDTRSAPVSFDDFKAWAAGLAEGKGWVPELPRAPQAQAAQPYLSPIIAPAPRVTGTAAAATDGEPAITPAQAVSRPVAARKAKSAAARASAKRRPALRLVAGASPKRKAAKSAKPRRKKAA